MLNRKHYYLVCGDSFEIDRFLLFRYIFSIISWLLKWLGCSVAKLHPTLQPQGLQDARPPCPSPSLGIHPISCSLNWWCHLTISSSAAALSFCLQSFPTSGSLPMSWLFTPGGQSIGASSSASVLPRLTGLIILLPKGLWRVFSNTTVQKHQFFGAQLAL